MHSSKLSTFVLDCKTDDLAAAARFWSAALRRKLTPAKPGDTRYRDLVCAPSEPLLMLQQVTHESRIHLDIESEDIPAEVARLEALGARALERIHTWVVMEAPTGQRFCVVRPQRPTHRPPDFAGTPQHAELGALAGHHQGTVRTFLEPDKPALESDDTLYIEPMLGGRFVRIQWFGSLNGKARQGELVLGYHVDAAEHELSWVDTFHTGSAILHFRGAPATDGAIQVRGSYLAGDERWGFALELVRTREGLRLRATNISPAGQEYPAIEGEFRPAHPGGTDDT